MASERKDSHYQTAASGTLDTEKMPARSPSQMTTSSNDSRTNEIKSWSQTFDRMQDERLVKQRYVMSGDKDDEISTNALGAKLDRALGRRMTGQDAVFTRSPDLSEKSGFQAQTA